MIRLAELFSLDYTVFIYGQEKYFGEKKDKNKSIILCSNMQECIQNSDVIISGMPLSKDNETVNSPYCNESISLKKMYKILSNKTFIAGGIPLWFYDDKTIKNLDLLQSEQLTILNAISTAEGTIKIAIEKTENTIYESNVMILGFGRIGKVLCKDFKNLGANVYCVARKEAELTWIREGRYIPLQYEEIEKYADKIDIFINTVPTTVLQEKEIKKMNENSLIIDIASNPGGVDKIAAKRYNIEVITALGIPGKIAPNTAAKHIKEVIEKIEIQK